MIVQLPIVCTDRMTSLQLELVTSNSPLWFANFDDRPGRLFDGLEHIRATILLFQRGQTNPGKVFSTAYKRWYTEGRSYLLDGLSYANIAPYIVKGTLPKIGAELAIKVRERIANNSALGTVLTDNGNEVVHFHNAPQYWVRAMDFAPYFWNERSGEQLSTQVKQLHFDEKIKASVAASVLNSSLFYWWFIIMSDCRHLNLREIETVPLGYERMADNVREQLANLNTSLMASFQQYSKRKDCTYKTTGRVMYDEYYPRYSKPIIDEIDRVLAEHYGFTDEELDFILNYDIKYRMGRGSGEEEE